MITEIAIVWIVSSIAAAGFLRAHHRKTMSYWAKSTQPNWDKIAFLWGVCLFGGPVALVMSFFMTGFWRCGWSLSPWDYLPEDGLGYEKQQQNRKRSKG